MSSLINSYTFAVAAGLSFVGESSAALVGTSPVSIIYPSGTQVGDIAFISSFDNSRGTAGVISTTSWTDYNKLQYKVLTSGDLTATIDFSNATNQYMVFVFRGATGVVQLSFTDQGANANSSVAWAGGTKTGTPLAVLAIAVVYGTDTSANLPTFDTSAPSMASSSVDTGITNQIDGGGFIWCNGRIRYNFTPSEYTDTSTITVNNYSTFSAAKRFWFLELT